MLKRYGTPPKRGIPYTRRPGAYVILPIGDGILLTYQGGEERSNLVHQWFSRHLDKPVDALLYILIRRECGE